MKNRAQLMDHSEDWVDESWTVDCVCGVNFDDGEEMVDCDECGVWVHTRCSRYVKGEKSFVCDKCKMNKNADVISDETEVAQLLVDLPKNTMKMEEDLYRLNDASSKRRPLSGWTDKPMPMEDRVHVNGIPGGDPQLFNGLSGIFTPQLWKAAGYVPKKFNFRYKEFPCWEQDEEKTSKDQHEIQSTVDTGANALYSMSKETEFGNRLRIPLGTRVSEKGENFDSMVLAKELKSLSHVSPDADFPKTDSLNEKSTRQSRVFNSIQQKKGLITSQNRTGKRKSRASDKDIDGKKRVRQPSGTGLFSTDIIPKTNGLSGYKDAKVFSNVSKSTMDLEYGELDDMPRDLAHKSNLPPDDCVVKVKKFSICEHVLEACPCNTANSNTEVEPMQKVEMVACQSTAVIKEDEMLSSTLINDVQLFPLKQEVARPVTYIDTDQREKAADMVINKAVFELPPCYMHPAVPRVQDKQISQESTVGAYNQTQQSKLEVDTLSFNIEKSEDGLKHLINHSLVDPDSVNCKVNVTAVSSSQCSEKEHMVQENSDAEVNYVNASDEFKDIRITPNLDSSEGGKTLKVNSLENNNHSVQAENYLEVGEETHSPTTLSKQRKMVVSVARSLSTNTLDGSRAEKSRKSSTSNGNKAVTAGNIIKEKVACIVDKHDERHRKNPKDSPRASESSIWKRAQSRKISHQLTPKESFSRSKNHESQLFAKPKQETIVTSDSGESAGSLQAQGVSLENRKVISSGSSGSLQKGRKHSQIANNTSSKTSNFASTNRHLLSASHAALSDEELALLLHQELNSSPRVPRIPRMRQAGCLPQSDSPTASNILSKRSSGFGGSECTSVSKRKYKDPSGDGTHSVGVKLRKRDKGSSSKYSCIDESKSKVDARIKRELDERSSQTYDSVKRKGHSSRNSLKNVFDEEIGLGGSPTYRTLPGLISEIMSKGKRMTYEELCNAVLPHWQNLRKHNGERYAYSSHSQAVLDCLRNRSEWAQLVDRGPKTNPGRKRRKLDAEVATSESEDGIVEKNKVPRVLDNRNISKQQDFPKGKRKARKRRRLALQGKEVKDTRKSRSMETVSEDNDEDDASLYSNSMEQSASSGDDDDDAQGSGSDVSASETSVSSDES